MIENYSPTTLPLYVRQVPDLRTCYQPVETDRCLDVLRWLNALPVAQLLRPRPPTVNSDLISVVVPMRNASLWIETCLKGLLAQSHSNIEIFCVDDCSEDDTYGCVVERFGHDRRLCIIRLRQNVGPHQIKNWVIGSLARGTLVALQDADDISHPMRLEEQKRWMLAGGFRICGTGAHQFFPPSIRPNVSFNEPIEVGVMFHNIALYPSVERIREPVTVRSLLRNRKGFAFMRHGNAVHAANHSSVALYATQMFDRSLFLRLGGFDGRTKVGADRDFSWRVLRFHSISNVPKVLYSRRFHERSLTQHSSTNYTSRARRQYELQADGLHERIRCELESGNTDRVRELCTADLFCGDIEVEEIHTGFSVDPVA